MKVSKLDMQHKMFQLSAQLGTMQKIDTVQGDIVLDDELKAVVYAAIRPLLEKRLKQGKLIPVFEQGEAIQGEIETIDQASMSGDDHLMMEVNHPVEPEKVEKVGKSKKP